MMQTNKILLIALLCFFASSICISNSLWAVPKSIARRNQKQHTKVAKNQLKFEVSFDKESYDKGESISVTFTLTNNSKNPLWVNKRFGANGPDVDPKNREVWFEAKSPAGEALECHADYEASFPRTTEFVLIEPGESVSGARPKGIKHFFDFDESGTYRMKAFYQNVYGSEIGVDAYKGRIVADELTLTIN